MSAYACLTVVMLLSVGVQIQLCQTDTVNDGSLVCSSDIETRSCFNNLGSCHPYFESQCMNGTCRCNDPERVDPCTCLPISGSCRIVEGVPATDTVGIPTFENEPQTNWSCVANENCNFDVHVIRMHDGNGNTTLHTTGTSYVDVNVSGGGSKPLVLVLVSYEPVDWILNVTQGFVIDKVLLGSPFADNSSVSTSNSVDINFDRLPDTNILPSRYPSSFPGDERTGILLEYLVCQFGPISSYTGAFMADHWTLNIEQTPTPGCNDTTPPLSIPTIGPGNVTCSNLGNVDFGSVSYSSGVCELSEGTTAMFTCNYGSSLIGSSELTCEADGRWSGSRPYCRGHTCSQVSSSSNGNVTFSDDSLYVGTVASYRCDPGYILVGSSARICETSPGVWVFNGRSYTWTGGFWSGSRPYCKRNETSTLCDSDLGRSCNDSIDCSISGSQCVDGYCRCVNATGRDYCTCLPTSGSCHISEDVGSVGVVTVNSQVQSKLSCVSNENCDHDVHVIVIHESGGNVVNSVVNEKSTILDFIVSGEGNKPLVVVLVSHEFVTWSLSLRGVVIDRLLLSTVSQDGGVSLIYGGWGNVLHSETPSISMVPYGQGNDSQTLDLLDYVVCRFGQISTFTYAYRADYVTLNIERTSTPGCFGTTSKPSVGACRGQYLQPANGWVNFTKPCFSVGTIATFGCDSGYVLRLRASGSSVLLCEQSGLWNSSEPYCEQDVSLGPATVNAILGGTLGSAAVLVFLVCLIIICVMCIKTKNKHRPVNSPVPLANDYDSVKVELHDQSRNEDTKDDALD